MKYLKTYNEAFQEWDDENNTQARKEFEDGLSDILNDINVDGFEWLATSEESGSTIDYIGITIFKPGPVGDESINMPFKYREIGDTMSHLRSHLAELKFRMCSASVNETPEGSIHAWTNILQDKLITKYYDRDITGLQISFEKVWKK